MGIKARATLFADAGFVKTGRHHPEHRDHGENDRTGRNLDHDVAA
jgi:hypothetical protein